MSFIGDFLGFGGGSDNVTNVATTSSTEPPAYALPHFKRVLTEAENLFDQPRSFFPGKTYTDFSAPSQYALGAGEARAIRGNPLLGQAQGTVSGAMGFTNPATDFLTATARGDFLGSQNPFMEAAMQPVIDSGGYGSGHGCGRL